MKLAPHTAPFQHASHDVKRLLLRALNSNRLTLVLVGLAVFCGLVTYGALTTASPLSIGNTRLLLLLYLDLLVLLALFVVIGRRVARLLASRRQGVAGSRLQVRLVTAFALMAALPVTVTTVFSAGLLYFGLHGWFDTQVRTAVHESLVVAQSYLNEHQQLIKADVLAMGNDLERDAHSLEDNPDGLHQMLQTQSFLRNFSETALLRGNGDVMAQSGFFLPLGTAPIRPESFVNGQVGDVLILTDSKDDRIQAVLHLTAFGGAYLYVARAVDANVLQRVDKTRAAVQAYQALADKTSHIQMTVTLVYLMVAGLLMMTAVWFGLALARRLSRPIAALVTAADRLRAGDTGARVQMVEQMDDFETLANAFNRMGEELEAQRATLLATNRSLDERRRFTETVLHNVSTGVLSVDPSGRVALMNPAACAQLGIDGADAQLPPALSGAIDAFRKAEEPQQEVEVPHLRRDGVRRRLMVRLAQDTGREDGNVTVTFDDITDLADAQKSAAWQDVARRIAHEIKNPLTPIQLSAERLKRRYLQQMEDPKDREIFERCTETIVRHVDDIKNMVNAFSTLARMPSAKPSPMNPLPLCAEVVTLNAEANPDMRITFLKPLHPVVVQADEQLLRQAVINLLHNAMDACRENHATQIAVHVADTDDSVYIGVCDTGVGIADHVRETLLDPYVTTKATGTGLGLAIVRKSIEEMGGSLLVTPAPETVPDASAVVDYTGARFYLRLPKAERATS